MPPIPDGWIDDHPQIEESSSLQSRNTHDDVIEELEPINYTADTRCAALFALLKEEVLPLLRRRHMSSVTEDIM